MLILQLVGSQSLVGYRFPLIDIRLNFAFVRYMLLILLGCHEHQLEPNAYTKMISAVGRQTKKYCEDCARSTDLMIPVW